MPKGAVPNAEPPLVTAASPATWQSMVVTTPMRTPEQEARETIDGLLAAAGWCIQDRAALNLGAAPGVAVREFPLETGFADYLLFADRKAVGVVEAKAAGTTLSGVADQSAAYLTGLPSEIPHVQLPLPFAYESTGVETFFRNERRTGAGACGR